MKRLPVVRNGETVAWAVVDDVDYERAARHTWTLASTGYVIGGSSASPHGHGQIALHRFVMCCWKGDGKVIDHLDHDPLNNRKTNLRVCDSKAENLQNVPAISVRHDGRTRYRGVTKENVTDKHWVARCTVNGQAHRIGKFPTEIEAAIAAARFRKSVWPWSPEPLLESEQPASEDGLPDATTTAFVLHKDRG